MPAKPLHPADPSVPAARRPPERRPGIVRWLAPAIVLLVGLVVIGISGGLGAKLGEVVENDQAAFLPESAESTKSLLLEERFAGAQDIPAIIVWEREGGITDADRSAVASALEQIGRVDGVAGPPSPAGESEDGEALQSLVPLPGDNSAFEELPDVVDEIQAIADGVEGTDAYVTGPGGSFADFAAAFAGIDGRLLFTALGVVFVILLLIYRSPVFIPVLLSVFGALFLAQAVVYLAADAGWITVDGQSQGILSVLVVGAGTDYALLLISRYKEELHTHDSAWLAIRGALRGATPPIFASGVTVILGLLCLLLSDLNSNQSLGPVAAIGIACSMLSMLVFLPALLVTLGRHWFWPFVPRHDEVPTAGRGIWGRVAELVGSRTRLVGAATAIVLVALAAMIFRLDATGLTTEEQFTNEVPSVLGQEVLGEHFPGGTGTPASVIGPQDEGERILEVVRADPGVASAALRPEAPPAQGATAEGPPKVVDGQVQVEAVLTDAPDSPAAEDTVLRLRSAVDQVGTDVLVGGVTAVTYDVKQESARDTRVIIPVVLLVIFVILAVLLRAFVAPLLLVATVVLSFAATLGVCALVFEFLFDFAGADPSFPLFAFVFLVALGIDYNIFLMTRVREETARHGTREGTLRGLAVTGGVITSAGVVLAATFAALGVLPLVFLAELGFAVAFGVLLDTLVVRSLLVPALVHQLGDRVWWPFAPPGPRTHERQGEAAREPVEA
ncbi:MMPL family transporter [Motilibacter deserti]|uniref:MMPL family transporter n=1 Tax=Motilibacter deserti TaxID=2714956 RepID=A0ABX0GS18_9ACTN|nr:MMPL family transporter [Motilibacter deserti]NHC12479.1 MMPL family transporter [Motilibacter deserti]